MHLDLSGHIIDQISVPLGLSGHIIDQICTPILAISEILRENWRCLGVEKSESGLE